MLVSASAVGFYGTSNTARFDESSANGSDYLAAVCRDWEAAAAAATPLGTRVVVLRMGIVLDRGGGALASMAPVFQIFAGGPLGDGRQWFSWIHRCARSCCAMTRALACSRDAFAHAARTPWASSCARWRTPRCPARST